MSTSIHSEQKMSKKGRFHLSGRHSIFDRFAGAITRLAGSPGAFASALGIVVVWALSGPSLGFSETWQLVINTGTTIVTFLMVFLIQQSQNKDSMALHIKLNELIASHRHASNRSISIEDLDAADLEVLRNYYCRLAELAKQENALGSTHSLDDANAVHGWKTTNPEPARRKVRTS